MCLRHSLICSILFLGTAWCSIFTSPTLKAKAWQIPSDGAAFPESALPELVNTTNSALCLSGGGSRAYIAGIGILRGLHGNTMEKLRYLTGVSGGAWATTSYSYQNAVSDEEFLGDIIPPENLTSAVLALMPRSCARYAATLNVIEKGIYYFADPFVPDDQFWIRAVSEAYLESFGISHASHFTWSEATKADSLARNPSLRNDWALVCGNTSHPRRRPFPVVTGTILGPTALAPYTEEDLFAAASILEMSPLYVGHTQHVNISYHSKGKALSVPMGGLIEPSSFGTAGLNLTGLGTKSSGILSVPTPEVPFGIGFVVGVSSWLFGGLMIQKGHDLNWMLKIENPRAPYWSPVGQTTASTPMYLSDGGTIDNLGLIPMLQRRVERIVIQISTKVPLALRSAFDPSQPSGLANMTRLPADTLVASTINGFFGVGADSGTGFDYSQNQVFSELDFPPLVNALQDAQLSGDGAVAFVNLTTVANPRWGIPAGLQLQMCWMYLSRALNWEKQLLPELHALVVPAGAEQDPSKVMASGPFKWFPHYLTEHLELTNERANLLADLTGWIAQQHAPRIAHLLND